MDLYLGRKVEAGDPGLAGEVAPELAKVGDRLGEIEHQVRGIARNRNQLQKYINVYKQLPTKFAAEMSRENTNLEHVLTELEALRTEVHQLPEMLAAKVAAAGHTGGA